MSLSSQIEDRSSFTHLFLNEQFPFLGSVQRSYRDASPDLQIPPCAVNPGTIGTAYDWRVRLLLEEQPDVSLALHGAMRIGRPDLAELLGILLTESGMTPVLRLGQTSSLSVHRKQAPRAPRDDEWLTRLAWVLAAYTELFRSGTLWPGSPLSRLGKTPTSDDLLALCPAEACADIVAMVEATRHTLMSSLKGRRPLHLGPTFAGSAAVGGADADIIAGGLLVDLKTGAGNKRADGSRRSSLDKGVLFQLIGYVLLDWDNAFKMDAIGLYAVRFDYLWRWKIEDLFAETRIGMPPTTLEDHRNAFKDGLNRVASGRMSDPPRGAPRPRKSVTPRQVGSRRTASQANEG